MAARIKIQSILLLLQMLTGVVFDIKEFAVHDGPGLRVTVFLKGCPMRCSWCHNPEGQSPEPQRLRGTAGERLAGVTFSSQALADRLNSLAALLRIGEGGVTFSGGEPLAQADFIAEVIERLDGLHVLLDTSGYAEENSFRKVAAKSQLVYFDLKLIDPVAHWAHIGVGNQPILRNLRVLTDLGVPFVIRVPLIPGVTDTETNLSAIARTITGMPGLQRVDLLPYNRAAGAKYAACGMVFRPTFAEGLEPKVNLSCFKSAGLKARIV
ncbi:MAG: radical SAM protein [Verrucomicrobiota bacterium]|jgi:pyruvate formate lyase activating enzyme